MSRIEGLSYTRKFLTDSEEAELLKFTNSQKWDNTLQRRTQHYGYRYVYSANATIEKAEKIPEEFLALIAKIRTIPGNELFEANQIIVNEYLPGQGISAHTDHPGFFGDTIVSVSLGSQTVMDFTRNDDHEMVVLERGSCVILKQEARYSWKHAIPSRRTDMIDGQKVSRGTRVSITFRMLK